MGKGEHKGRKVGLGRISLPLVTQVAASGSGVRRTKDELNLGRAEGCQEVPRCLEDILCSVVHQVIICLSNVYYLLTGLAQQYHLPARPHLTHFEEANRAFEGLRAVFVMLMF